MVNYNVLYGSVGTRIALLVWMFLFNVTASTGIYTLSLHDALPIWPRGRRGLDRAGDGTPDRIVRGHRRAQGVGRSEEHTSELQSRFDLVCRLLLEKKKVSISLLTLAIIPLVGGSALILFGVRVDRT